MTVKQVLEGMLNNSVLKTIDDDIIKCETFGEGPCKLFKYTKRCGLCQNLSRADIILAEFENKS